MKGNNGQISGEYLLLSGVLIIVLILSFVFIAGEDELNRAMAASRNGVIEGIATSSSASYPTDTYYDYSDSKNNLLDPYSVELVNISYTELGWDNNYDKKKIRFEVYAKASKNFNKKELDSIGDRITFNTTSSTNSLYNPVFSPHYVYTTANVKWV